jgi:CRP/FNR family transcriptional regulator, anaerobic regulatory protein
MNSRHTTCDACAVRHRAVCGALSDDELTHLNAIARFKRYTASQVILRDHDEAGFFGNVIAGVVKLTKSLADGRQQIVGLQFPSDFLGRPFRDRSPYFAEAASEVTLCIFERGRFEQIMRQFPGIERRLFEHTLDELDAAQEWMVLLGRKTAGEKLASFLLMVARRSRQAGCGPDVSLDFARFELALSRSEIADYLGLTIETVSRQITSLKRSGVISVEK